MPCRDTQPELSIYWFLTPSKGIRAPGSLGLSRMIILEVLEGFLCSYGVECWVLTLGNCCD